MSTTLSVNEIFKDLLDAFRVQTPELFAGFTKDFSSNTAVLGDRVTARIAHVPVTASYDANNGGFYNGAQDVLSLIEDCQVTLNQLRHVPVKLSFLTGLATKGVDLYKAAVANIGYALGKYVVDQVLTNAVTGAVSNSLLMPLASMTLDSLETLRAQCNSQKMANGSRWCFLNGPLADALQADQRLQSKLFFSQLQGGERFRKWTNVAGFSWVRQYEDFPAAGINVAGLAGDPRLAVVSVRKIHDMTDTAKALGIQNRVMEFYPLKDEGSGLELTGIAWQEGGTGDVYLSAALLFGVGVGNQGGAAGTLCDNAGCVIRTA